MVNRGNTNTGIYDFQLAGGLNVNLSHLTIIGANDGIHGSLYVYSTGLTVSYSTIFGNLNDGIYLDEGNNQATFLNNTIYGDQAANGTKQPNGIYLNSDQNIISGNTVYDHSGYGIYDNDHGVGGGTFSGNLVYGNSTGYFAVDRHAADAQ